MKRQENAIEKALNATETMKNTTRKARDLGKKKDYSLSEGGRCGKSLSQFFDIRILDIDDVAELLGWSKGHIYRLSSKGEIPCRQRGRKGKLFFIAEEIFDWIEGGFRNE